MAALRPTTLILMLLFAAFSAAVPVPQGAADAAGAGAGQETANDNNPFGPIVYTVRSTLAAGDVTSVLQTFVPSTPTTPALTGVRETGSVMRVFDYIKTVSETSSD